MHSLLEPFFGLIPPDKSSFWTPSRPLLEIPDLQDCISLSSGFRKPRRSMLGYIKTSDIIQTGQRCFSTPHLVFSWRIIWLKRVQTVWPQCLFQLWMSLETDGSLCPVRALHYHLDRTSGKTKMWSVSFKKGFNKDISPATISWIKLWSYAKSSLIKRPLFYIRLKPMMSGPLLPLRHSSQESPSQQLLSACLKSVLLEGCGLGWFRAEPPSLVSCGGCPADLPLVHTQISSLSPYQRVFKLAVACSRLSSHLLLPKRASPGTELKPLFPHLRGGLLNKGVRSKIGWIHGPVHQQPTNGTSWCPSETTNVPLSSILSP